MSVRILWILSLLIGCSEPKATIPTYFQIKSAKVKPFQSNSTVSQTVKDVWVFQYPDYIGTFEMPTKFPIIKNSEPRLILQGGVWENNVPYARVAYPFWKADTLSFQYQPEQIVEYEPTYEYFVDTLLVTPVNENFETNEIKFELFNKNLIDTTSLLRSSEAPFDGIYCGKAEFSDTNSYLELVSVNEFSLPREKTPTWLEITYKSSLTLKAGLITKFGNEVNVLASDVITNKDGKWNTMYLNLSQVIARSQPGTLFRLYIFVNGNGEKHTLFLDNIRIIHFKIN